MFTARPSRLALLGGAVLATALVLTGCSSSNPLDEPSDGDAPAASGDAIVVGSQAYYSNEIVAEIYAQALEGAGFDVERQFNIGQRDAYIPELESGKISLFPEYTGNLLQFYAPDTTATSADDVYAALQEALPDSLTALDYAQASDQDSYTVTKKFAADNDLTTIADLANVDGTVTLGGAPELEQRPYGPEGAKTIYGVDLAFSATGDTTLESLLAGEIQVANIFTADPAFETEDIVALQDPKSMFLASNVVPIASAGVADEIADTIDAVSAELSAADLVAMDVQSTVDQKSSADIAAQWLKDKGLV